MIARAAAAILALAALAGPARAEDLVIMMSTQDVAITSNYTGARVVLFGSIERDGTTIARAGRYEVAVTVTSPLGGVVVRARERLGPIWVNRTQRRYIGVPGYFAVLSTGPVTEVANEESRRRRRLNLDNYLPNLPEAGRAREAEEEVRAALLRLRKPSGLMLIDDKGVNMVRPNLFSAVARLPASAPTGRYTVSVNLLSEGLVLKTAETSFVVRKIGLEAFLAASARDHGLLYGIGASILAVFFGFMGNLIFRKD